MCVCVFVVGYSFTLMYSWKIRMFIMRHYTKGKLIYNNTTREDLPRGPRCLLLTRCSPPSAIETVWRWRQVLSIYLQPNHISLYKLARYWLCNRLRRAIATGQLYPKDRIQQHVEPITRGCTVFFFFLIFLFNTEEISKENEGERKEQSETSLLAMAFGARSHLDSRREEIQRDT